MACTQCGTRNENLASGFCRDCEREQRTRINGLLYLPALGLVSNAIYNVLSLYYISGIVATHYHFAGYITGYALFLLVALTVDFLMTLYAGTCFFCRLVRTKYVMAAYYLVGVLYAFYLAGIPLLLCGVLPSGIKIRICSSALGGLLIWLPYFLRSRRVMEVFTR